MLQTSFSQPTPWESNYMFCILLEWPRLTLSLIYLLSIWKKKKIRADSEASVSYFNAAILRSLAETIFWDCRDGSDQQGKKSAPNHSNHRNSIDILLYIPSRLMVTSLQHWVFLQLWRVLYKDFWNFLQFIVITTCRCSCWKICQTFQE